MGTSEFEDRLRVMRDEQAAEWQADRVELAKLRAARAADAERIKAVVLDICEDAAESAETVDDVRPYDVDFSRRIATRVAEQPASPSSAPSTSRPRAGSSG